VNARPDAAFIGIGLPGFDGYEVGYEVGLAVSRGEREVPRRLPL
jgi:hypothetical protein